MTTCPACGGDVVEVGKRAWCVKLYATGGCGGFWQLRAGRWRRSEGAA
jgi:hypothetical protein